MDSDSDDGFLPQPVKTVERDSESRIPSRSRACAVWLSRAALDLAADSGSRFDLRSAGPGLSTSENEERCPSVHAG